MTGSTRSNFANSSALPRPPRAAALDVGRFDSDMCIFVRSEPKRIVSTHRRVPPATIGRRPRARASRMAPRHRREYSDRLSCSTGSTKLNRW